MPGLIRTAKGARNWDVRYSMPEEETYANGVTLVHMRNKYAIVISDTAATAIALILAEYPAADVHQVNCKGAESTCIFLQEEMVVR